MNFKDFKKYSDWTKVWSGKWSLHSDTGFGENWTVDSKVAAKPAYRQIIYIFKNGITDCWVRESDKDYLGKRLIKTINTVKAVKALGESLKSRAGIIFDFIKAHDPKLADKKAYLDFWKIVGDYYLPHLSVKYIVDYLSEKQLKKFLPILEDARLFSEPVFRDTENFMEKMAEGIAQKSGYTKEQIISTTKEEINKYFKTNILPAKKILSARYSKSGILFDRGKYGVFVDKEVDKIEKMLSPQGAAKMIKGNIAYGGKVFGPVRIVLDPKKDGQSFKKGEILVTGMTRPEFLPMMKKASAFITDAGGILSHAAIVARELRKPCLIGTKIATKILKDGDLVEVDADKGIVKIIK
ncbi:MAG TPA: PEP-utilizing enzyme [Candidatus Nanoarchaeia archaeon]|nr:PEP-utilizing enzyme [Candidatus Nanoarchaeia archaeon]